MKKGKVAALCLVGAWALGGAVMLACSSDKASSTTTTADAGVDAHPSATATTTTTATTTSTSQPDTGAPDDDDDAGEDAGDAGPHGLWGFNAYCNFDDPADAGCNVYDACPSFDGGGIAAQDCDAPLTRCLSRAPADSGVRDRLFLCETTATNAWELNRICAYENCADVDAAACSNEAGVGGFACDTAAARCIANNRVFICQPNTGLVEVFNGYCDAGDGVAACPVEAGACVNDGGPIATNACATDLERCLATEDGGFGKVFVCGDRAP